MVSHPTIKILNPKSPPIEYLGHILYQFFFHFIWIKDRFIFTLFVQVFAIGGGGTLRYKHWIREREFEVINASIFEPSQGFRAKKKWANSSRNLTETELIEFWAISGSHACSNLWQISFDDFLSYLRVRPVCSISSLFRIGLGQFQSLLANFGLARISLERFLVRFGLVLLWS